MAESTETPGLKEPVLKLNEWKVTDADGATINKVGTYGYYKNGKVNNPYMFYVAENPDARVLQTGIMLTPLPVLDLAKSKTARVIHDVKIIMPLGGETSGLYRYPKIGEMVLVASDGAKYYLMGYVPSSDSMPFNQKQEKKDAAGKVVYEEVTTDILDKQGEVFRYKKLGEVATDANYSEIGFYQEKTKWETETRHNLYSAEVEKKTKAITEKYKLQINAETDKEKKKELEKKMKKEIAKEEEVLYPTLDRIKIQSTGDIYSSAVNHHSMTAKRFDLKVNNGAASISIDAKGNVSIKGNSISLKAGRTSVKISDDGFSAKSKLVNSDIPNTYDAKIGLSPRDGFSASGMNCKIAAVTKAQIGDGMGGSLGSELGVLSVKAREIKMATYNSKEYAILEVGASLDLAQNIAAASFHNMKDMEVTQKIVSTIFSVIKKFKKHVLAIKKLYGTYGDLQETRAKAIERDEEIVRQAYKDLNARDKEEMEKRWVEEGQDMRDLFKEE
ncbi:hypothetical protein AGMMS50212_08260 [Spirochaetia bacterium]|nr:hypothetical protein AGMMS50212_08260 [Spirochaetia bacterium]